MKGQYSIYDTGAENRRPCEYPFQRYIGQPVKFYRTGQTGVITEIIDHYYTVVLLADGSERIGIPWEIDGVEE